MPNIERLDAGESIFFTRELETIRARNYDKKFEEPRLLNILPISMEGDPNSVDITHRSYTRVGMAKMGGGDYATDYPRVDVYGTETTVKVVPVKASYGYNKDEIARAMKVGRPLEAMRATAARKTVEMKLDEVSRIGNALTGVTGLYNAANISSYTVPDGATSKTTWADKTADEILADLNGISNYVLTSTNGIETVDTLALPMGEYLRISQKRMSTDIEKSILTYFLENNPNIKTVTWLQGLDTAAPAGSYDGTQAMFAWKNDPEKVVFDMPMPYQEEEVMRDGLEYVVPCRAKTAGVTFFYPMSCAKGYGI